MELSCAGTKRRQSVALLVLVGIACGAIAGAPPSLPEGDSGIASKYPRDANIGYDPAVVFSDDFESYTAASDLNTKWSNSYHAAYTRIATEAGNVYDGSKALEFTLLQSVVEISNAVMMVIILNLE